MVDFILGKINVRTGSNLNITITIILTLIIYFLRSSDMKLSYTPISVVLLSWQVELFFNEYIRFLNFFVKNLRSQILCNFFSLNLRIIPKSQIYYNFLSINLRIHYFSKYNYEYFRILIFLFSKFWDLRFIEFFSTSLIIIPRSRIYYDFLSIIQRSRNIS